jgi:hypothetical protein
MIDTMLFTNEYGEVCPAGWQKGDKGMTRVRVEWNKLPDFIKHRLIKYYEDAGYKYDESNVSGDYLDWSEPDEK